MSDLRDLSAFTVPLALTAHQRAKGFQRHQASPAAQKRVYLNTLAVYAVATYLETLGYEIDWAQTYSYQPTQQTLLDVADVLVAEVGRLECRPVLPGATTIAIPAEVTSDRLAYLGVQLDAALREATLLGFVPTLPPLTQSAHSLPFTALRPLEELGAYLAAAIAPPPLRLSQWWQNIAAAGWQVLTDTLEELTPRSSLSLAFRSPASTAGAQSVPVVGQRKTVLLGQGEAAIAVALLVGLLPQAQGEVEIWVQLSPPADAPRLPATLQLQVLDEDEDLVMQAEARETAAIQLKFVATAGERFSIRVVLGDSTLTEVFEV